ncbi:methionine biosynthesis protein MetW, putative [marine gamma proteobacterium HTCC2148]|nr:methionine biosynthesis protein MetW, putative [marine gamma proteobacterium HTCC2148]
MSRPKFGERENEPIVPDIKEIKEFYDSVYHAKAPDSYEESMARHYSSLFRRLGLRAGQRVLDVACGTGGWLKHCSAEGLEVAGIDLSERAIGFCDESMPNGEFYAQPAESLPFEADSFDVVTCLGSLEHFVDPAASLREMARVAKPGAVIVLLVPNKDFLTRKLGLFAGTYQVDAKEVVRTLDEWQSLFQVADLKVIERWKDLHVLNLSWVTTGKWYFWPVRAVQALCLPLWPLKWQYQVYHRCTML